MPFPGAANKNGAILANTPFYISVGTHLDQAML